MTGLLEISTLTISAVGSPICRSDAKYVLSKGSVMQSPGWQQTNCGSIGPPPPIESLKYHWPWLGSVTKALNFQTLLGLALGDGEA